MTDLAPGSEPAVDAGCRCPVEENQHGQSARKVIRYDCPLHGHLPLQQGDSVVFPDHE